MFILIIVEEKNKNKNKNKNQGDDVRAGNIDNNIK